MGEWGTDPEGSVHSERAKHLGIKKEGDDGGTLNSSMEKQAWVTEQGSLPLTPEVAMVPTDPQGKLVCELTGSTAASRPREFGDTLWYHKVRETDGVTP